MAAKEVIEAFKEQYYPMLAETNSVRYQDFVAGWDASTKAGVEKVTFTNTRYATALEVVAEYDAYMHPPNVAVPFGLFCKERLNAEGTSRG